jgi:hypothetical protein
MLRRLSAKARSHGAGLNARSVDDMVMKIRDSDLDAEREKRQPHQSQTESRYDHQSPRLLRRSEVGCSCVTIVAVDRRIRGQVLSR